MTKGPVTAKRGPLKKKLAGNKGGDKGENEI
jgi:hypothetical protein